MYIKRNCKVLLEEGFMHILTVFGYWNPMGFISKFCLIKTLCSVDISRVEDEKAIGYVEMNAKSKKVMHFIKFIKQYKELALMARDAGKFLGRRAVIIWENGEEYLSEWSERGGDGLYQLVNSYERGVMWPCRTSATDRVPSSLVDRFAH